MSDQVSTCLFKYLCEISRNFEGYNLYKLVELIEFYREAPKLNHDFTEVVTRMNKLTNNFSNYYRELNASKPFGKAFDFLSIAEELDVSVVEICRKIMKYYGNIDKKHLSNLIKFLDTEKLGFVKYEDFYGRMYQIILDYEHSIVLHLRYLCKKIKKDFEGNYKNFLQSKGLTYNTYLKEGDFYEKFKEYFFKDLVLIKKFVDSIKEKGGKNIGTANCLNICDMINKSEEITRIDESEKLNDEKNIDIISIVNKIEKSVPLKNLYEYIEPSTVNIYGKISSINVKNIMINKMGCKQEDTYFLIKHFSSLNILFDLFDLIDFLKIHSVISIQEIDIILNKIKDSVMKVSSVSSQLYFKKLNLDQFQHKSLPELMVILRSVFKITHYEAVVLFLDTYRNPLNNLKEMMISFDMIFQLNLIYEIFPNPIKKTKLDNYMKLTLKKLYEFINKSGNIQDFFDMYDIDKNGVLSREEFLTFLTHYQEQLNLTDSEKIISIKIADFNNDCSINFPEFMKFLDIIKNEFPPSEREDNVESKKVTQKEFSRIGTAANRSPTQVKITTKNFEDNDSNFTLHKSIQKNDNKKIDSPQPTMMNIKILNEIYLFNRSNESCFSNDVFLRYLFKIQGDIIEDMNKYTKTIEELFVSSVHDNVVPLDIFVSSLEKFGTLEGEEQVEKLLFYSSEGLNPEIQKKLILAKEVDYNRFFMNLERLKLSKLDTLKLNKRQKTLRNQKILEKKKSAMVHNDERTIKKSTTTFKEDKDKEDPNLSISINDQPTSIFNLVNSNNLESSNKKEVLSFMRKNLKDKLKLKYKQKHEIIEHEKEKDREMKDDENKEIENLNLDEILPDIDHKTVEEMYKLGIDPNSTQDLESLRSRLSCVFAHDQSEVFSNVKWTLNEKKKFLQFIVNLINLDYKGYDYTTIPERDYFKRQGKLIPTILNSEDAAIKKCEELFNQIEKNNEFTDKDFGPQPNDNGVGNKFSLYINGTPMKGHMDPNMIDWYRMTEISPDHSPRFIDDGAEANDVMQGALGDCWFISALSVLATKDHLLRGEFNPVILNDGEIDQQEDIMLSTGIYPPIFHKFRMKNIFCFRFYKNFEFRYVIIDDKLPCRKVYSKGQIPKLLYGKCRNDREFWVPLIEKAYAKLHGCYEALISGFIDDGLVDLTGFSPRKQILSQSELKEINHKEKLWETLKKFTKKNFDENELGKNKNSLKAAFYLKNNSMVGCSVDAKVVESEVVYHNHKSGILAGHAYALLDAFSFTKKGKKKESKILRIRNPWGFKEWNGKWSDESDELEENKEKLQELLDKLYEGTGEKVVLDAEDGTFLMCFSDFRQIFNKLFICIDFPPTYIGIRFKDKWNTNESGGIPINNTTEEAELFAKNPQYYISFSQKTNCYISLMQNDGRLTKERFPYQTCTKKNCIIIFKSKGKEKLKKYDEKKVVKLSSIRQHRENSIHVELEKGEYIIVPAIFKAGETGEFVLEVHFEGELDAKYDETNFLSKIKNTKIERLDPKYKYSAELLTETGESLLHVMKRKKLFIYKQFRDILLGLWTEKEEYRKHDEVQSKTEEEIY